jgi:hypothetical protein
VGGARSMGLDAVIFCDCVERKRLRVPHPYPRLLYIRSNGSPEIRSKDPAKVGEHDEWMELPPCAHGSMMIDGCDLGSIGLVDQVHDALQAALKPSLPRCPVLLGKVLYDGGHTGDHLTVAQVGKLAAELQRVKNLDLKKVVGVSSNDLKLVIPVITKLDRLVKTSRRIGKPIAF